MQIVHFRNETYQTTQYKNSMYTACVRAHNWETNICRILIHRQRRRRRRRRRRQRFTHQPPAPPTRIRVRRLVTVARALADCDDHVESRRLVLAILRQYDSAATATSAASSTSAAERRCTRILYVCVHVCVCASSLGARSHRKSVNYFNEATPHLMRSFSESSGKFCDGSVCWCKPGHQQQGRCRNNV